MEMDGTMVTNGSQSLGAVLSLEGVGIKQVSPMPEEFPLHKYVLERNMDALLGALDDHDINGQDVHGNTPLQLAVMLGQLDVVKLLLSRNASVKSRNRHGWSALAEAISYGDRTVISCLYSQMNCQSDSEAKQQRPALVQALHNMPDFYLELKWDFSTWIPLLHRLLPSDTCRIYKRGGCIRLDSSLVDFSDLKWQRGDITFMFVGAATDSASRLYVLDNARKVYQTVSCEVPGRVQDDEVDMLMSTDIVSVHMSTKNITFTQSEQGWFHKSPRRILVGKYESLVYAVHGIRMVTRKRREHLTPDDLRKNKQLISSLVDQIEPDQKVEALGDGGHHRCSLPPPPPSTVSWREYITAESGRPPCLGRPMELKTGTKQFRATVAMCDEFALTTAMLIDVLNIVAPFKQFAKLRDFISCRLPPGFPVRLDLPLLPAISAQVTFLDCQLRDDLPAHMFTVPVDYTLDRNRFPGL